MEFNRNRPDIICLDVNSCFATIEQQANPNFRNKPLVVAAYNTNSACILAASIDAKKIGIKTGMRVGDARIIFPKVKVLLPDPPKYRFVHRKIKRILKDYSDKVIPKSIDEFVLKIVCGDVYDTCLVIKERIKREIGEYITVSIGISTNRYLAKVASNLKKPDGLSEIRSNNFRDIFSNLKLTDLTGIKKGNSSRLKLYGINSVNEFYDAPVWKLKLAFGGIGGLYWHTRLHGYEIDDYRSIRKTYGNSYAPPAKKAHLKLQIISKLCQKTGSRLRKAGLLANGVSLAISFRDGVYWHKSVKTKEVIFESRDIYKNIIRLLELCPYNDLLPRVIAINVFSLKKNNHLQLNMFDDDVKKISLTKAVDNLNDRYGDFTVYFAGMTNDPTIVQDRIAFGQS
jgi:DNA polymerase-4